MSQEMYFSRMQKLLKDEYNAYIESFYEGDRRRFKKENGGCSWCSRHKYYRAMKKIHGIE